MIVVDASVVLEVLLRTEAAETLEARLLNPGDDGATAKPPALVAKEPQLAAARAKLAGDIADEWPASGGGNRLPAETPVGRGRSRDDAGRAHPASWPRGLEGTVSPSPAWLTSELDLAGIAPSRGPLESNNLPANSTIYPVHESCRMGGFAGRVEKPGG